MSDQQVLIEGNIQDVVKYIVEDTRVSIQDALFQFYQSNIFEKLQDTSTGLYLESAAYIYELFLDECRYGRIIQKDF